MHRPGKPSRTDLMAAKGKAIPDIIGPHLQVLFCGINPGLYSAATGHHFARPGNRFWPTLHRVGFTDRQLIPAEERALLEFRCGITNLVSRSTASAAELTVTELSDGRRRLTAKVRRYSLLIQCRAQRCLISVGCSSSCMRWWVLPARATSCPRCASTAG